MKTLWNAVSFLAVVNLLAMAMFLAWLWRSDRLSEARIEQVKEIFTPTLAEAEAGAEATAAQAEAEALEAAEQARRLSPPASSAESITFVNQVEAREQQAVRRLRDEVRALREPLEQRAHALNLREAQLEARDQAWRKANQAAVERRTDGQFLKTVKLYESQPPKQARQMLIALVDQGRTGQAVAYLNAMNTRIAAKIIAELKTAEEVKLATELLEELRTFGLPPEMPEDSSDADTLASADESTGPDGR